MSPSSTPIETETALLKFNCAGGVAHASVTVRGIETAVPQTVSKTRRALDWLEAELSHPSDAPIEQRRTTMSVRGLNKPAWEMRFFFIGQRCLEILWTED